VTQGAVAQIGFGQVRHTRLRPRRHAFAYATWFLLLPMRRLNDAEAMGGLASPTAHREAETAKAHRG